MGNVLTADQSSDALWREVRSPGEVLDLGVPLRQALGLQRLVGKQGKPALSRREGILLGLFALTLHGAVLYWLAQRPEPVLPEVPVQIPPMTIEFASAPPPPEPVVQEVVKAPEPVVDELAVKKPEPPKPVPKPKPQPPKPKPVPPQPAPPKAVEPPPAPVSAPVAAAPAPAPTLTPPSASAGYLKNPAPEYPSLAQRRGWQGTVLLRVRVLASGKPGDIQIQQSSGRDVLDQAAVRAVQRWSFVPAKRGDVPQEGWVSVPLDFKLN